MKIDVLRTAVTIKCDKEDNIFYGKDYDIRAFYNPDIQATMVRIHNSRKNRTVYTTFANVAYCEIEESELVKPRLEERMKKPSNAKTKE